MYVSKLGKDAQELLDPTGAMEYLNGAMVRIKQAVNIMLTERRDRAKNLSNPGSDS